MNLVDKDEVQRFEIIAKEWWDPHGKFRPLHQLNPARIFYVKNKILETLGKNVSGGKPLKGVRTLDVGCGGGLLAEPLARLGATVTGLDPARETIEAARRHAAGQSLDIEYIAGTTEDLNRKGRRFDCVIALEVVEHVPDLGAFLKSCEGLMEQGGLLILSTLNRTGRSFALGIVAAEYVLGWLPRGTHRWSRLVTPEELTQALIDAGLHPQDRRGLTFDPIGGNWRLTDDVSVNYLMSAVKPA